MRILVGRGSLFVLACVAALLAFARADTPPAAIATPHGRDIAGCDCPKLPVINDDAHVARGQSKLELTYDDLHALFGTRDARYGSWPAAIAAMAREADPTNALGIATDPQPPVIDNRPIVEGVAADYLITGNQIEQVGRVEKNPFNSRWFTSRFGGSIGTLETGLIWTLARSEKYGEPAAGIRDASLRLAHFLAVGLAPAQNFWQSTDARIQRVRGINGAAARTLIATIDLAEPRPSLERGRAQRLAAQAMVPLTDFDLAQAALEILTFGDETHAIDASVLSIAPQGQEFLLMVAAGAQRFGGPAAPTSDMGIVACRAYSALVTYMSVNNDAALKLRQTNLRWAFSRALDAATMTPPWISASMALVRQQGPMTSQEALQDVDVLANAMIAARSDNASRQHIVDAFSALLNSTGDAVGDARSIADRERRELIKRQDDGLGDEWEKAAIAVWPNGAAVENTGATASSGPSQGPTCSNGSCNVALQRDDATLPDGFEWAPTISVVSSLRPNRADGVESVARDEQFVINVSVPAKEDPGNIEVHVEGAHGSSDYALRYENTQNDVVTYTSMAPVTFELGGDGSYGFFRKLMHTPITQWFWHNHGDFRKMDTDDGEIVKLSVLNTTIPLTIYDYSWTQRIAANNRSLNALWSYYDDLLQNDTVSQSMKAMDGPIHRRLHLISNYRQILEYQSKPEDRFIFSMVTKANIGDAYLALLQKSDAQLGSEMSAPGYVQSRVQTFPNVKYADSVEAREVTSAVDEAQREAKGGLWHNFAGLAVAFYDGVVAASCFEVQIVSGGLAPCADQIWTLLTGTDTHGNEVSGSAYALTALQVASPLIEHAGALAMQEYAEQTVREQSQLRVNEQPAAQSSTSEAIQLTRRSQAQVQEVLADFQELEVQVGALNKREKLRIASPPTVVGATEATGIRGPPMPMQKYDDNCFLTSLEYVRRRRGQAPMTQEQMIAKAWRFEQNAKQYLADFKVYRPGGGTFRDGRIYLPQQLGFEVETVDGLMKKGYLKKPYVSINQMQAALHNGHDVMVVVDSTDPATEQLIRVLRAAGKPEQDLRKLRMYHSVVVTDVFKDAAGTLRVTYGDPWNGKFWTVDACTFDIRSVPTHTIVIR